MKISYRRGKGKLGHNNRDFISDNVDKSRIKDNIIIKQEDIKQAYQKIFGQAQEEYNKKQKRSDRKIDDYFKKLFGDVQDKKIDEIMTNKNKQQSFYENVVGIGDKSTAGFATNPDVAKIAVECLEEYARGFQERNKNFYVFNSVIHCDEATPHLHFDYIPYSDEYKRGMTRQQSISKALEEMGFGTGEQAIHNFTVSERKVLNEICKKHGLEIESEGQSRGYTFTCNQYREFKENISELQAEQQKIEKQIAKQEEIARVAVLQKFVDSLQPRPTLTPRPTPPEPTAPLLKKMEYKNKTLPQWEKQHKQEMADVEKWDRENELFQKIKEREQDVINYQNTYNKALKKVKEREHKADERESSLDMYSYELDERESSLDVRARHLKEEVERKVKERVSEELKKQEEKIKRNEETISEQEQKIQNVNEFWNSTEFMRLAKNNQQNFYEELSKMRGEEYESYNDFTEGDVEKDF